MMSKQKQIFISFIFLAIFSYFLYHTIYGNRGISSRDDLKKEISRVSEELRKVRADLVEIDHQVKLLRPETLDKDMLEEQAKKILGIAKEDEEIIVKEETKEKK